MADLVALPGSLDWPPVGPDFAGPSADGANGAVVDVDVDRRVADVSRRLARLLDGLPGRTDGPLASAATLLADLAETQPAAWPATGGLDRLVTGLRCSPVEVDLLILAGLPDEHEALAGLFRMLHPRGEPRPTLGLAAQLFCEGPAERPFLLRAAEQGPASKAGLIRLGPADGPTFEQSVVLADGLWHAIRGIGEWPEGTGHRPGPAVRAGLDDWLDSAPVRSATLAIRASEPRTIFVTGEDEDAAVERGVALVEHAGVPWTRLMPPALDADIVRLIAVHALVRGVTPVVRLPAPAADGATGALAPDLGDHPKPVVLAARSGTRVASGSRPLFPIAIEPLDPAARRRMWQGLMPSLDRTEESLAARHVVEPALAARVADDVRNISLLEGRAGTLADLVASIRARAGVSLTPGVRLIRPAATWSQLVLPDPRIAQLRDAVGRLMHQEQVLDEWGFLLGRRGARGVRMLFAGPPGTGKTLAAEVLAAELGVDLLVVDIARVVSKWIGETEKNLAEVFDTAERMNGVLLFDEADALFGKRTDVSDAHDRYANLETAYLLARLERSEGLVILATNLRSNVDPAFTRRLEAVVTFEEPGLAERLALWSCHFPPDAPLATDVNLEELSMLFPVVGGVIRNAAVAAAFLAAADGSPIAREHVILAIQREYEKQGRAFPAIPGTTTDRSGH